MAIIVEKSNVHGITKKDGKCESLGDITKNSKGENECDYDRKIASKSNTNIEDAIKYLDWHFEADDGTAGKDAQKAWYVIKSGLGY